MSVVAALCPLGTALQHVEIEMNGGAGWQAWVMTVECSDRLLLVCAGEGSSGGV